MKSLFKSSIITSCLLFILGCLLLFKSEATIATISYLIGAILIVVGAYALIRFFTNSKKGVNVNNGLDIVYGIVSVVLGILVINNPNAIASILPIILGIAIIISGANKIQYALNLKNSENELWKTTLIIATISTLCGVVLLFNPFSGAVIIMRIVGIFIIAYAILDIVSTVIIKKNVEEFKLSIESSVEEAVIVEEKPKKKRTGSTKKATSSAKKTTSTKSVKSTNAKQATKKTAPTAKKTSGTKSTKAAKTTKSTKKKTEK